MKRNIVRILPVVLALGLSLSLVACGGSGSSASVSESASQASGDSSSDVVIIGYTIVLPEGWDFSEDDPSYAYPPDYPGNTSNINVNITEKDPTFADSDIEGMKDYFQESYASAYTEMVGSDVTVNMEICERTTVDGFPAAHLLLNTTINGVCLRQLQYVVDADQTYTFTFTQAGDEDLLETFEASAATIAFAVEGE